MATKFSKGQEVKVNAVIPQGPVQALKMDENGNFYYLVGWTDEKGVDQTRWFDEADLVSA